MKNHYLVKKKKKEKNINAKIQNRNGKVFNFLINPFALLLHKKKKIVSY